MIEIKFTGEGDAVAFEIARFAAQIGTGMRVLEAASRKSVPAEAEGPKTEPDVAEPEKEQPKAEAKPRGRPKKELEVQKPAPVVESVEQKAEDVFDEEEQIDIEEVIAAPKTRDEMKTLLIKSGLTVDDQIALVKKFSSTGKLSGVPESDFGKMARAIEDAKKANG